LKLLECRIISLSQHGVPASAASALPMTANASPPGQFTYVEQQTSGFTAPYRERTASRRRIGAETGDASSIWGRVHGRRGSWLNAEIDQGRGLDNTLGVRDFQRRAYKVGRINPIAAAALILRQTVDLR